MGVTKRLAEYAAMTEYSDLPSGVVEQAKLCILNILGVSLAGYKTRIGGLHIKMAKEIGGGVNDATIFGDGAKVSAPLAAYANGNLGFALDYEDMIHYILHPGYISVASGLAIGEKMKSNGKDFMTAIVMAYEVASRIGLSMQPTPERGSQVWGEQYTPFASVVPAGKLLQLDAEKMEVAFGITGTYATVPSAYKYFGIVKDTRPMREVKLGWGWMCMAGVFAALSADEGFRGGKGILDGDEGFWIMEGSDRCDFDVMTQGLGEKYYILETEYKVHPSIGWVHPVHSRLKEMVEEHDIQPEDIQHINVKGMQTIRLDDFSPAGAVDAQFSLPYTVVSTVLRDPLTPAMYDEERIHSPQVQSMLKKVTVEPDAEADQQWFDHQRLVFEITVTLNSGKNINSRVVWPDEKPSFGEKEVKNKFTDLASLVLPENRVVELMNTVMELENIDDVGTLSGLMY